MDKNSLLLVFVLFLFSSQLWNISWNIGLSLFYMITTLSVLNLTSPDSEVSLRSMLIKLINLDSGLLKSFLKNSSKFIIGFFGDSFNKIKKSNIMEESTDYYLYTTKSYLGSRDTKPNDWAKANDFSDKTTSILPDNPYKEPAPKTAAPKGKSNKVASKK
jgi:hypothetical protein